MLKRFALIIIAILLTLSGKAETIGTWQIYPSYFIATKNVAVGDVVYSLMNGNLIRYDNSDQSVQTYDFYNSLNGIRIVHMDYCDEAKRLLLVYEDGNIDIMDQDDHIINISALRDKALNSKTVQAVTMNGSTAYLCTGFGLVTLDMKEAIIRNTYQLNMNVTDVAFTSQYIWLNTTSGVFLADIDANLHNISSLKKGSTVKDFKKLVSFKDTVYALHRTGIFRLTNTGHNSHMSGSFNLFRRLSDDTMIFADANTLYIYSDSKTYEKVEIKNNWNDISLSKGIYWASDNMNGLKGFKLKDNSMAQTVGPIQPNSPVRDLFYRMQYVGDRLLVAGGSINYNNVNNPGTAMFFEEGNWTNFDETYIEKYPKINHQNFCHIVQDPNDADHHYVSAFRKGIYEFRKGKFQKLYNSDNSPIQSILPDNPNYMNYCSAPGIQYDAEGNLWMLNAETDTVIRFMTPAGKWYSLPYTEMAKVPTPTDYLFTSSGVNFVVSRRLDKGFFGFDTKGTLTNIRDDRHKLRGTIINEDGSIYNPDEFYCMAEDLDGRVWCGTNLGLFVIEDPNRFFDEDFTYEQIKIARNDGSGLADYLLNGVSISCIAVDGANRKWIGTEGNGLYLVSADGQEMIHHFLTTDSPLLSNNINCVAIHPTTGLVMIGTDKGLCSYMADATEAEEELDSSNVLAYPNPVNPDYIGPITIDGLTMNSEIKICSSTGQLVMSGVSNGGRYVWNGCNQQGRRVSSGVYQVIANTEDGKKAIVTRIIVIR